jgi:hypothetical protein
LHLDYQKAPTRKGGAFAAFMRQPTSPYGVAGQIRQIIESDSWRLRYPVGHTRVLK